MLCEYNTTKCIFILLLLQREQLIFFVNLFNSFLFSFKAIKEIRKKFSGELKKVCRKFRMYENTIFLNFTIFNVLLS